MSNKWEYNSELDAFLWGTVNDGCGVFKDNGAWEANVIIKEDTNNIYNIGSFASEEIAKKEALKEYKRLKKNV